MWWFTVPSLLSLFSPFAHATIDCGRFLSHPEVIRIRGIRPSLSFAEMGGGVKFFFTRLNRGSVLRALPSGPNPKLKRLGLTNLLQVEEEHFAVLDRDHDGHGRTIRIFKNETLEPMFIIQAESLGVGTLRAFSLRKDLLAGAFLGEDGVITLAEFDLQGGVTKKRLTPHRATPFAYLGQECIAVSDAGELLALDSSGKISSRSAPNRFLSGPEIFVVDGDPARKRLLIREAGRVKVADLSSPVARVALFQNIPEKVANLSFGPNAESFAFTGRIDAGGSLTVETVGVMKVIWDQDEILAQLEYHTPLVEGVYGENGSALARYGSGWVVAASGSLLARSEPPQGPPTIETGFYFLDDALYPLHHQSTPDLAPGTIDLAMIRGELRFAYEMLDPETGSQNVIRLSVNPDSVSRGKRIDAETPLFPKIALGEDQIPRSDRPIDVRPIDRIAKLGFHFDGRELQPIAAGEGQSATSGPVTAKINSNGVSYLNHETHRQFRLDIDRPEWLVAGPAGSIAVFSATSKKESTLVSVFDINGKLVWQKKVKFVFLDLNRGIAPYCTQEGFLVIPKIEISGFVTNSVYRIRDLED